ncbi:MAG: hypothetical protein HY883_08145 [Deltaproteobacteria bacterium]|nr:hypothetical protein [Deltaproteobacteria bacterium]
MKVKSIFVPPLLFLVFFIFFLPSRANAVPAFARQTGFACNTCHYQHFPTLNEFGRAFKAGGYTMVGGQSLVEGDLLSLPSVLNASVVAKIRYQKTNGSDDLADKRNRGELQFPDEAALFMGGRVGEHIGFVLEAQLAESDAPTFANFKMPIVYDVGNTKLSLVPFTTDGGGAAYGFELLNTGAITMHKPLEHGAETSAQRYLGTTDGAPATGVAFVAYRDIGYVNFTLWSPEHESTDAKPLLRYVRAVLTPHLGSWDLGFGAQVWDGETKFTEDTTTMTACIAPGVPLAACTVVGEIIETTVVAGTRVSAKAWAADFQAQGAVGRFPLGVYFTYGAADRSSAVENLFNSSTADNKKAFTATGELGVIPGRLMLALGWRNADNGMATDSKEDATTAAAMFLLTQNVQFQLNQTWYNNDIDPAWGDSLTTFMMFAAF